jgi:hypothetical protein
VSTTLIILEPYIKIMNTKSSLVLLIFAIMCFLFGRRYVCTIKGLCEKCDEIQIESALPPISFGINSDSAILGPNFEAYRDSICLAFQNQEIYVEGHYFDNETNTSESENIGFARAKAISKLFSSCFDSVKIHLNGVKNEGKADEFTAISYSIAGSNEKGETKNKNKNISLTGHTDNTGSAKQNLVLSYNNANSIKNPLISKGMPSTQITAAGKGDAEAIVEENMAMNRRVELKIK